MLNPPRCSSSSQKNKKHFSSCYRGPQAYQTPSDLMVLALNFTEQPTKGTQSVPPGNPTPPQDGGHPLALQNELKLKPKRCPRTLSNWGKKTSESRPPMLNTRPGLNGTKWAMGRCPPARGRRCGYRPRVAWRLIPTPIHPGT